MSSATKHHTHVRGEVIELAIDPGPATGFCLVNDRTKFRIWNENCSESCWHSRMWDILELYKPDRIILERFMYIREMEGRGKLEYFSLELIGVVRLWCQVNQGTQLVLQTSAQGVGRSAFWGDSKEGNDKIRRVGLWKPTAAPHGMDAVRHYLYWDTFTNKDSRWLMKLKGQ